MRFLIVGCGSMGKRRARCLGQMGFEDIAAVDPREDRRAGIAGQSQVRVHEDFDEALRDGADFALVCVPPHHHAAYLMRCIDAHVPVFCEAPMTLTLEEAGAVIEWNWHLLRTCAYTGPQFREEPAWHNEPLDGYDFETMYVDEFRHAFYAFEGKVDYLMPPRKERRVLEWVLACERSSREGRQIDFAP